jgi:hypothetical protein
MSKILRRRTGDGRHQRLLLPTPAVTVILRRRTADGRVRRILRSAAASAVAVNIVTPATLESLSKVVAYEALSIEWSALPAPVQISLERLLASPGKRRLLGTPGRLRLLKRL